MGAGFCVNFKGASSSLELIIIPDLEMLKNCAVLEHCLLGLLQGHLGTVTLLELVFVIDGNPRLKLNVNLQKTDEISAQ